MAKTRVRSTVMSEVIYQAKDCSIALTHVVMLMAKKVHDPAGPRGAKVFDLATIRIKVAVRDPLRKAKEASDHPRILDTEARRAIDHGGLAVVATTVALNHRVLTGVVVVARDPMVLAAAGMTLPELGALGPLWKVRKAIDLRDLILRGVMCHANDPIIRAAIPRRFTKDRAVFDPRDHFAAAGRKDPVGPTRLHISKKVATLGGHLRKIVSQGAIDLGDLMQIKVTSQTKVPIIVSNLRHFQRDWVVLDPRDHFIERTRTYLMEVPARVRMVVNK
jgi:hypothetical protein